MAFFGKILRAAMLVLVAVMLAAVPVGCSSSRTVTGADGRVVEKSTKKKGKNKGKDKGHTKATTPNDKQPSAAPFDRSQLDTATAALLDEAYSWMGTPYVYGGNTREGVDCSGYVLQVYQTALGIPLPRVSREQYEYCSPMKQSDLRPGDLVFFATTADTGRVSHVGIYVGSGRMLHSSASRGVMESDITGGYFASHFYGAGRVDRFHAMRGDAPKGAPKAAPSRPAAAEAAPALASTAPATPAKRRPAASPMQAPAEPAEPADPIKPDDSIKPVKPVKPAEPTEPQPQLAAEQPQPAPEQPAAPAKTPKARRIKASNSSPAQTAADDLRQAVLSSLPDPAN